MTEVQRFADRYHFEAQEIVAGLEKELKKFRTYHAVEEVDEKELIRGAITGMLRKLDQYSTYFGPEQMAELKRATTGSFGGRLNVSWMFFSSAWAL